jgi:hypothetical protein
LPEQLTKDNSSVERSLKPRSSLVRQIQTAIRHDSHSDQTIFRDLFNFAHPGGRRRDSLDDAIVSCARWSEIDQSQFACQFDLDQFAIVDTFDKYVGDLAPDFGAKVF